MKIAAYAHGSDYHDFLREKTKPILKLLAEADKNFKPRFFTDSGPVFDRYWAWKAGLGFIGKNGFLIHPQYGSRVFLAHIFTSLDIETAENQLSNACGNCTRCLDSCPTNAFNCNGTVDARKCIAYWFIENKDEIPQEIIDKNPGWIFGCDICQQACPFNQKPIVSAASVEMKGNWTVPASVQEWLEMSEEEFRSHFENTPLKRAGLAKIKNSIMQLANK